MECEAMFFEPEFKSSRSVGTIPERKCVIPTRIFRQAQGKLLEFSRSFVGAPEDCPSDRRRNLILAKETGEAFIGTLSRLSFTTRIQNPIPPITHNLSLV